MDLEPFVIKLLKKGYSLATGRFIIPLEDLENFWKEVNENLLKVSCLNTLWPHFWEC